MKILFWNFNVAKAPSRKDRLNVIEMSFVDLEHRFEGMGNAVNEIGQQLEDLAKKAEATRRKVYRDDEQSPVGVAPTRGFNPLSIPAGSEITPDILQRLSTGGN